MNLELHPVLIVVFTYFVVCQARILWIDEKNLTACCESGIIGQDLERRVCAVL